MRQELVSEYQVKIQTEESIQFLISLSELIDKNSESADLLKNRMSVEIKKRLLDIHVTWSVIERGRRFKIKLTEDIDWSHKSLRTRKKNWKQSLQQCPK